MIGLVSLVSGLHEHDYTKGIFLLQENILQLRFALNSFIFFFKATGRFQWLKTFERKDHFF